MIIEKSCGAVVFTRQEGLIKYVIVQSKTGVYGFPKGHVEDGESEEETARREIFEETRLKVDFIKGFRAEDTYTFEINGKRIKKNVVYFLAEYSAQAPIAQQSELNAVCLMDYESCIDSFQFENSKKILSDAYSYLMEADNLRTQG